MHPVKRASNDRKDLSFVFCVRQWPRFALIFKFSHEKLRALRAKNCAISVPKVRATRTKRAQTHSEGFHHRSTHPTSACEGFAAAAHACRAKTAPKFIEIFALFTVHHEF